MTLLILHRVRIFVQCSLILIVNPTATMPDQFILFTDTTSHAIYRMDLSTRSYVKIPLPSLDTPIAIDYDYIGQQIYWTDVGQKMIYTATLDGLSYRAIRVLPSSE